MYLCVCVNVSELVMGCLSPSLFFLIFEKQFPIVLVLTNLATLAGQQDPGIHQSLPPQFWDDKGIQPHLVFFSTPGCWDLNSGPHALTASHALTVSASLTGLFLQAQAMACPKKLMSVSFLLSTDSHADASLYVCLAPKADIKTFPLSPEPALESRSSGVLPLSA